MAAQIPFGGDDFAANPEPRLACVLLLDVSRSMAGERISSLNEGLQVYKKELTADTLASQRVEVAIVTFGGQVETVCPFVTADKFEPPRLTVKGDTPMGAAINHAVDLVDQRKQIYRQKGLQYFRPWIFLITDGGPTDEWKSAAARVREEEEAKKLAFFAVGVQGAKFEVLQQIATATRPPQQLEGLRFRELFQWLSASQRTTSHSQPGEDDKIIFPNRDGWTSL
jgi:uncharacterized protein YegL